MEMANAYEDSRRAEAYARLEFPGTYYLAFRDLPRIIHGHVVGRTALDFGCGTGRSTRYLKEIGFDTVGVDIAEEMIAIARQRDPQGKYHLVKGVRLGRDLIAPCDLVLSAFTFDNIPTMKEKVRILGELRGLLNGAGCIINMVSSPDMYTHEWESISTKDFPENRQAKNGDLVKTIITAIDDPRPINDILWMDDAYQETYRQAGLAVVNTYRPLAKEDEPYDWVNETRIAPWVIYVLKDVKTRGSRKRPAS